MRLTEAEIEQFLLNRGPSMTMGIYSALPNAVVREYGSDIAYGVTEGLRLIAHAIAEAEAERLREGMVWERQFVAKVHERPGYALRRVVLEGRQDTKIGFFSNELSDGQLVTVTVTARGGKDADS